MSSPLVGEVFGEFVSALDTHKPEVIWQLLSPRSRAVLGGSEQAFASSHVDQLTRSFGVFAHNQFRAILAVRTSSGYGIAAVAGPQTTNGKQGLAAAGAALIKTGNIWQLELTSPIGFKRIAPLLGNVAVNPAIEVRIEAAQAVTEGGLWLDGKPLAARATGSDPSQVLITSRSPTPLRPGSHTVVVYAVAGGRVSAAAFTFQTPAAQSPAAPSQHRYVSDPKEPAFVTGAHRTD